MPNVKMSRFRLVGCEHSKFTYDSSYEFFFLRNSYPPKNWRVKKCTPHILRGNPSTLHKGKGT
jgi:hypothetical protein